MKNKFELIVNEKNETITSLELLEGINYLRELEYKLKQANNTLTQAQINRGKSVELRHSDLLSIIEDELDDEITERKISSSDFYIDKSGKSNKMYILDFDNAMRVLLRESKYVRKAIIKKLKELRKNIAGKKSKKYSEWLITRDNGKMIRRNLTDNIKKLIIYAIRQGCDNTKFFYSIYSKLANKTAGIKNGTRDKVNMVLLNRVAEIENIFSLLIEQSMDKEIHYKEIYQLCKKKGLELEKVFSVDLIE